MLGAERFDVRGAGYAPETEPSLGCEFARDLPLLAAMGANTVRTYKRLPDGDSTLTPLLETTGLYWLADFPLDSFYDSGRSLAERSEEILAALRAYAVRFRHERRLIGYVIGINVAQDYGSKFAGPVSDYYALLARAAEVSVEVDPDHTPLVAAGTSNLDSLALNPDGLSFWLWEAGPLQSLSQVMERLKLSRKPVLVSGYGIDVFNPATQSVDEQGQAEAASRLTREIQASGFLLGGVYRSVTDGAGGDGHFGIFRLSATERPGVSQIRPRAVYRSLSALWEGKVPSEWQLQTPPELGGIQHAASGQDRLSPGTLARLTGSVLEADNYAANGIPWPFHLNHTCFCVGGRPAPIGMLSPGQATAQIPWDLPPGEHPAVVYRAGLATNIVLTHVDRYSPGVFEEGILRAGTSCLVTRESGVRPGEALELYATGVGPGAPSWTTPTALINGLSSEVLYSGTLPTFVGLNQINLRINPLTPPGPNSTLLLQVDDASSAPYSLAVAAPTDRFGIFLAAPDSEVVVQAGGPAKVVEVQTEGRNGYCGPVLLGAMEKPDGVILQAPIGSTGERIPVEVRATSNALPQTSLLSLSGQAAGAVSGTASIKVTVLAGAGEVRVRVFSGGFPAGPFAQFDWNGRVLYSAGGGAGRGINVLAVDPATGVFSQVLSFDTWGDESASGRLVSYLSGLQPGTVVLFAVADDGTFQLSPEARKQIAKLFGSRAILKLGYQQSWAMIGRVGAAAPIAESSSLASQIILEQTLRFPVTAP